MKRERPEMRIGLAYDLKDSVAVDGTAPADALEEYDCPETVELIDRALVKQGHRVVRLCGGREFLNNILRANVDIVFNIAEGQGNKRSREAQVPAVLEMLGIPYSGSEPECLTLCLDKPLTKQTVSTAGIPTPRWWVVKDSRGLRELPWGQFPFPAIIKPAWEGSSKGIHADSLADSPQQTIEVAGQLIERYRQPVMVEEFISGDEITVGIVGNSLPRLVGLMRIVPRLKNDRFVYSLEVKRDYEKLADYECPAQLEGETLERIKLSALRAFEVTGCRDFARLDFRVSSEGIPYFIEINPLPGLGTYSDLVIMAIKMGWTHEQLINMVFDAAVARYAPCVPV
jgi:D-alanine-D-alanine ligase